MGESAMSDQFPLASIGILEWLSQHRARSGKPNTIWTESLLCKAKGLLGTVQGTNMLSRNDCLHWIGGNLTFSLLCDIRRNC
jgi:hypothetical protein